MSIKVGTKTIVPSLSGLLAESYINGSSWYRVYSDGWCEQGGRYTIGTDGNGSITLLKAMSTPYSAFINKTSADSSTWNNMFAPYSYWTTTTIYIKSSLVGYALEGDWIAYGYII